MTAPKHDDAAGGASGTIISHLVELRGRLLRSIVAVLLVLFPLVPFSDHLFTMVAAPLLRRLPAGTTMIATQVASPFLAPFKLALVSALFIAMPYVLYQVWSFVAPGLYKRERRFAVPMLIMSIVLFYTGVAFAYFVVFPVMFGFFTSVAPQGVTVMTDIAAYLDFILAIFFAFGMAFQVPVATVLLVWVGFTTPAQLAAQRSYVFLGAFVVGAVLTPPDVFSQTLLAIPMYLLYEGGIFMARVLTSRSADAEAGEEA
jgi:sec-independent protein translocase protein TatC